MNVPDHVLRAVAEQGALDAVALAKKRKFQVPGTQFLLDLAKGGVCGQPADDRRRYAVPARTIGQWHEGSAASDAFLDLADVLELAEDGRESHELCARAVAGAWRAGHPFRQPREGDPLDVLLPHRTDEEALRALDRARALPPSRVPAGLVRRAGEIEEVLASKDAMDAEGQPYSRSLALALLKIAEDDLRRLNEDWWTSEVVARVQDDVQDDLRDRARIALKRARAWVERDSLGHSADLERVVLSLTSTSDGFESTAETFDSYNNRDSDLQALSAETARVAHVVDRALRYVGLYNNLAKQLSHARTDAELSAKHEPGSDHHQRAVERVRRLESLFPDFFGSGGA